MSVCVTVFVLALHLTEPTTHVPSWIDRLLFKPKQQVSSQDQTVQDISNISMSSIDGNVMQGMKDNQRLIIVAKWKRVAKFVNAVFFYMFLCASVLMIIVCGILWGQS